MPTYLEMYLNILDKFGKKSSQLEKYYNLYLKFPNNKKIVYRYYKQLMEETK